MTFAVGVDVVDLQDPRARDRSGDDRFLERVFTASERERIRLSDNPALEVWVLWAAKEAGFKVASKVLSRPPVFQHAAFSVSDPPGTSASRLTYEGVSVHLGVDLHPHRVMVWAWNGPSPEILVAQCRIQEALGSLALSGRLEEWQADRFSPLELDAIHGLPSALVRLLARRDAARMLRVGENHLAITCSPGVTGQRPPYLELDGTRIPGVDVSLSHAGEQLAWAVRIADSAEG